MVFVGRWRNPYKHEALYDRKGQAYEVFYYLNARPGGQAGEGPAPDAGDRER